MVFLASYEFSVKWVFGPIETTFIIQGQDAQQNVANSLGTNLSLSMESLSYTAQLSEGS